MRGSIVFPFAQRPLHRDARARVPVRPLAPRVAPAAVRVPDPRHVQIEIPFPAASPQIFVHEGARQRLERRLARAAGLPATLGVTDNLRRMISFGIEGGLLRARLHHMFLDAPARVEDALVRFIATGDREASTIVGRFIDRNGHRLRASQPVLRPLATQGEHHDLYAIFTTLNDRYFGGTVDALVTWGRGGRRPAGRSRRSIKLGSYSTLERLIRVHPVLDRPWIPRYFVAYVLYHEMLHHVVPAVARGRRRLHHPPKFVERERLFRDYERALAWERTHLHRLLRVVT